MGLCPRNRETVATVLVLACVRIIRPHRFWKPVRSVSQQGEGDDAGREIPDAFQSEPGCRVLVGNHRQPEAARHRPGEPTIVDPAGSNISTMHRLTFPQEMVAPICTLWMLVCANTGQSTQALLVQ